MLHNLLAINIRLEETVKYEVNLDRKTNIGILGGTFDPPHDGHIFISQSALSKLSLDEVWWIVTTQNPLKEKSSIFEERFKAARSFVSDSKIKVEQIEKNYNLYTIDTIFFLKRKYPNVNFVWIMGLDNLYNFHEWKDWKKIFYNIPIAIFHRPPYSFISSRFKALTYFKKARIENNLTKELKNLTPPAWTFVNGLSNFQSSTKIRKKMEQ